MTRTMYLIFQWLLIEIYNAVNFLKGVYQCQTDIVPVAGVLCPLLVSFSEITNCACWPWCHSMKPPIVPLVLNVPCAVHIDLVFSS